MRLVDELRLLTSLGSIGVLCQTLIDVNRSPCVIVSNNNHYLWIIDTSLFFIKSYDVCCGYIFHAIRVGPE
jgi:hypothetical protein